MAHSQNEAAYFYAEHDRMKNAAAKRKAAGKEDGFGGFFALIGTLCAVAAIGAIFQVYSVAASHVAEFFSSLPF